MNLDIVLTAATRGEWGEGYAGVNGTVNLYPAEDVAVPATLVVSGGCVAVGSVVDEEMGSGNLIRVVDPVSVSYAFIFL